MRGGEMLTAKRKGGRLARRPVPGSLGLLPSGPDPVGERPVRHQPPGGTYRGLGEEMQERIHEYHILQPARPTFQSLFRQGFPTTASHVSCMQLGDW